MPMSPKLKAKKSLCPLIVLFVTDVGIAAFDRGGTVYRYFCVQVVQTQLFANRYGVQCGGGKSDRRRKTSGYDEYVCAYTQYLPCHRHSQSGNAARLPSDCGAGVLTVIYIVSRAIGKIGGAFLGEKNNQGGTDGDQVSRLDAAAAFGSIVGVYGNCSKYVFVHRRRACGNSFGNYRCRRYHKRGHSRDAGKGSFQKGGGDSGFKLGIDKNGLCVYLRVRLRFLLSRYK